MLESVQLLFAIVDSKRVAERFNLVQ